MPSLAEVKRQIDAYPYRYIFWTQKEVRALPDILDHDEPIKAVTSGMVDGSTWLLVCTDRRLIFLNCRMFFGARMIQIPLERIQAIDHNFTIFFGNISVWDGATSYTLRMVLKSSILPFVREAEEAMYTIRQHNKGSAPDENHSSSIADQLAKLAELKEKGHLTEAEFQLQKKKVLSS